MQVSVALRARLAGEKDSCKIQDVLQCDSIPMGLSKGEEVGQVGFWIKLRVVFGEGGQQQKAQPEESVTMGDGEEVLPFVERLV